MGEVEQEWVRVFYTMIKKGMEIAVCLHFKNTLEKFKAPAFFHYSFFIK